MNSDALTGKSLLFGLLCLLACVAVALVVSAHSFMHLFNGMVLSMSLVVVLRYFPASFRGLMYDCPDNSTRLISGIVVGFTAIFLSALLRLVFPDAPDGFTQDRINLLILLLICVAAALHITAPGATRSTVPPKNVLLLIASILFGVFIGIVCSPH